MKFEEFRELCLDENNGFAMIPSHLIPYLIHFGEKNISPEIIGAIDDSIVFRKINGKRLDSVLQQTDDLNKLSKIYGILGSNVAYTSKFCIYHNDFRPDNVIIDENSVPYMIDWDRCSFMGLIMSVDETFQKSSHGFFSSTKECLEKVGKLSMYSQLQKVYYECFKSKFPLPPDITSEEIIKYCMKLYGIYY